MNRKSLLVFKSLTAFVTLKSRLSMVSLLVPLGENYRLTSHPKPKNEAHCTNWVVKILGVYSLHWTHIEQLDSGEGYATEAALKVPRRAVVVFVPFQSAHKTQLRRE